MRRILIFCLLLPTFLSATVDIHDLIYRALAEGEAGTLLCEEVELQHMSYDLEEAEYLPFIRVKSNYQEGDDVFYSFYEYILEDASRSAKETLTIQRSRTPTVELAVVKKFIFGPEIEFFADLTQTYGRGRTENMGGASTTLLDDNTRYQSLSDQLSTDFGARFKWNVVGQQAAKDYTQHYRSLLQLHRNLLNLKVDADNFVTMVLESYYEYCRARVLADCSAELLEIATAFHSEMQTLYDNGEIPEEALTQAYIDRENAQIAADSDQFSLETEIENIQRVTGYVPPCDDAFEDAAQWVCQEQLELGFGSSGDDAYAPVELARIEAALARLDYQAKLIAFQHELNLNAEARRKGNNHSRLPTKDSYHSAWSVSVDYTLTFNPTSWSLDRRISKKGWQQAERVVEEACRQVRLNLNRQKNQLDSLSRQLRTQCEMFSFINEKFTAANTRFDLGQINRADVLMQKQALVNKKAEVIDLYFSAKKAELFMKKEKGELGEFVARPLDLPTVSELSVN